MTSTKLLEGAKPMSVLSLNGVIIKLESLEAWISQINWSLVYHIYSHIYIYIHTHRSYMNTYHTVDAKVKGEPSNGSKLWSIDPTLRQYSREKVEDSGCHRGRGRWSGFGRTSEVNLAVTRCHPFHVIAGKPEAAKVDDIFKKARNRGHHDLKLDEHWLTIWGPTDLIDQNYQLGIQEFQVPKYRAVGRGSAPTCAAAERSG